MHIMYAFIIQYEQLFYSSMETHTYCYGIMSPRMESQILVCILIFYFHLIDSVWEILSKFRWSMICYKMFRLWSMLDHVCGSFIKRLLFNLRAIELQIRANFFMAESYKKRIRNTNQIKIEINVTKLGPVNCVIIDGRPLTSIYYYSCGFSAIDISSVCINSRING